MEDTFTAMIEGVEEKAVSSGLISRDSFKKGIEGLYRTTEPDGVFSYTFFKGAGIK